MRRGCRFKPELVLHGEPVNNDSAGMRARLAFAISMAIEFDCFLIDEAIQAYENL